MSTEIPNDYVPFVQRMVAARRFLSEADVLAEGLRLLQAREFLRQHSGTAAVRHWEAALRDDQ